MTSIWDFHGSIAHQLSEEWDEEKARRLKESLQAVFDAVKDRPEYQDYPIRWTLDLRGKNLLEAFKYVLGLEWKQEMISLVAGFVSGDLHEFDHDSAGQRPGQTPLLFNGRLTFGHHTEVVMARARGNKKYHDIVSLFERDY